MSLYPQIAIRLAAIFMLLSVSLISNSKAESDWKIEFLYIEPSLRAFDTAFGNSALLLIPPGENAVAGTVWQCREKNSYIHSIDPSTWPSIGGKSSNLELTPEPALVFFSKQMAYEFRNVNRHILPTTFSQGERLLSILNSSSDPSELKAEDLIKEECTTTWLSILSAAGLPINLKQIMNFSKSIGLRHARVPVFLRELLITPFPVQISHNLLFQVGELQSKHKIILRSVQHKNQYLAWNPAEEDAFKKFEKYELVLATQALSVYDDKRLPFLRTLINRDKSQSKPMFNITSFPDSFYRACETQKCAIQLAQEIKGHLSPPQILLMKNTLVSEIFRSQRLLLSDIDVLKTPQAKNWQFLIQELRNKD